MVTQPLRATHTARQFRLHAAEMLASLGVLVAAVTLIALIWLVEIRSIETQTNELRARAEATVSGQAVLLAEQIRHDMLGVEQSLRVLKAAFQADPDHFDMKAWRDQVPALTDITDDVFIADAQYIIRHDINPAQVGLRIDAKVPGMFAPTIDKPEPSQGLLIGSTAPPPRTREHPVLMFVRLDRPGGWVAGVAYHTAALQRLFIEANLGVQGMAAMVDTRLGRVEVITGPAAANPNYDIADTPMYAALQQRPDGTWIGASALDGVSRIHGFRQLPGHPVAVVVAVDEAEAMRPAIAWAQDVRSLALAATLVVLAAMGVALYAVWTFRSKRRLRQNLERELILVDNAQRELAEARSRLAGRSGQFEALSAGIGEGALVLDAELHLSEWNRNVPVLLGISPEVLRPGLPLDDLLRVQATEGAFGPLHDVEGEVARRVALLKGGDNKRPTIYGGPGGRNLAVFTSRHSDGSLLLVMREATEHDLRPPAEPELPALESTPESGPAETF
jgi:PAS domain-containing protein